MNRLIIILLLCFAPALVQAADISATIKQEAEKCAKAIVSEDYETVVTYTHKRVVTGMGGKESMIAKMKQGAVQMRRGGYDFVGAKIGTPAKPQKTGAWLTSLVPQEITMKVPGGRLLQESKLLAISENDGASWVFLDLGGGVTATQLAQIFPELSGQIQFPEKKKPVFYPDKK